MRGNRSGMALRRTIYSGPDKWERLVVIGVRAGARTGYGIPGRDENGGWRFEEIIPPSSSSLPPSAPKSRVSDENGILCFLTHSRAMHFLALAYESYGGGGSFFDFN